MMRGRAVAARRAHNPEVSGSNPLPATKNETLEGVSFYFRSGSHTIEVQVHSPLLFSRRPSLSMLPFGDAKSAEMVVFGLNMR